MMNGFVDFLSWRMGIGTKIMKNQHRGRLRPVIVSCPFITRRKYQDLVRRFVTCVLTDLKALVKLISR